MSEEVIPLSNYYLKKNSIANNLSTSDVDKVLAASQGKILQDTKIDTAGNGLNKTNTTLNISTDIYNITEGYFGNLNEAILDELNNLILNAIKENDK